MPANQVTYRVHGLKEMEQALLDLVKNVEGKGLVGARGGPVKSALWAAALPVLKQAKINVPKKTHRLKNAIVRQRHKRPRVLSEIVGVGIRPGSSRADKKGAFYANPVHEGAKTEFGTLKMPARPFLRNAMNSKRAEALGIFSRKLGAGIEKIAIKIGNQNAARIGARAKRRKL